MTKMKIIVAVLNWGLGHASRSVPVIRALEQEGFEPVLASDGEALLLLRKEFPSLNWLELPSYNITYPEKGSLMRWHFLRKGPQILMAVVAENRIIRNFIAAEGDVAGIISDNRLGAFTAGIPSAYLTHQLRVFSGKSTFFTSKLHQFFINKFSECWVPDVEGSGSLAGRMSHNVKLSRPIKYLGLLSRFSGRKGEKKYDLLVLLSGPEPQRSLLEEQLLKELQRFSGNVLFVRGKLTEVPSASRTENMQIRDYLTGKELEDAIISSEVVLARSGYSTIMDLAVLGKKAFFIPTPGQYEQEFLASRLQKRNIAPYCKQREFSLEQLEKISATSGFPGASPGGSLPEVFALFKGK